MFPELDQEEPTHKVLRKDDKEESSRRFSRRDKTSSNSVIEWQWIQINRPDKVSTGYGLSNLEKLATAIDKQGKDYLSI